MLRVNGKETLLKRGKEWGTQVRWSEEWSAPVSLQCNTTIILMLCSYRLFEALMHTCPPSVEGPQGAQQECTDRGSSATPIETAYTGAPLRLLWVQETCNAL